MRSRQGRVAEPGVFAEQGRSRLEHGGKSVAATAGTKGSAQERWGDVQPSRGAAVALAVGAAGIVLVPYATTTFPHRLALVIQACLILACTGLATVAGVVYRGWWQRLVAVPGAVRAGVVLYAATAVAAALVAAVRGNEPSLLAGQLLSLGLLPLGFLAGASNPSRQRAVVLAWSLAAAGGVAALLHFAHWAMRLRQGQPVMRLYMGNSVSLTGASLLLLLLALALAAGHRSWRRTVAAAVAGVVALFIVGSGTRSLWLVSLLALAMLAVLARVWRVLAQRGVRAVVAAVLVVGGAAAGGAHLWWRIPRRNLLPDAATLAPPLWRFERGSRLALVAAGSGVEPALSWSVPQRKGQFFATQPWWLEGGRLYRFSLQVRSDGTGVGRFGLATRLDPRTVCQWRLEDLPANPGWRKVQVLLAAEHDLAVQVLLGTQDGASGTWTVKDVRLEVLPLPAVASLQRQLEYLGSRLRTTVDIFEKGPEEGDENAAFRLQESLAVWRQFWQSPVDAKIFGHGLGARYDFRAWGWSDTGRRVFVDRPNYIHNFYAFLLLKTGFVGSAAVLAALGLWFEALRRAARRASEPTSRWLATAVLVGLVAYSVWSLVCPEILDFRIAPLWGLLLGALSDSHTGA
ncbi:MAG: hypothetical protein HXY19_04525 [Thermoanaerobaculaceae bacterium]|nr:hypothetical protein [Thermoanaerobaculaceae bacterium]